MRLILLAALFVIPAAFCSAEGIGIAYIGQSGQAERTLDGFNERMREIAPEMLIETRGGLADAEALGQMVGALSERRDGVILVRSNGSQWLADHTTTVPTFIAGGNHPPTLGAVMNMDAPEGNVTGVTYFLDHSTVMEIFVALAPEALNWEVFTQTGHPAAGIDSGGVKEACVAVFISCKLTELATAEDVAPAIRGSGAEAFLIGNQAPLYDNPELFAQAIEAAGDRPVFSLNEKPVEMGALASMSASDHKLGRMLADKVVAVLRDGQPISRTPVGRDVEPVLVINPTTMERLGVIAPRQMLAISKSVGG